MIKQIVKIGLLGSAFSFASYCAIKAADKDYTGKTVSTTPFDFNTHAKEVYYQLLAQNPALKKLSVSVFTKAYNGFINVQHQYIVKSPILTICDFTKSSTEKRLWVIDFSKNKVLFNTLVSHGKNTGEEYAVHFSNKVSSYQSSLGFYLTDETYQGGNGYSLKLKGLEPQINDKAMERAIVMHGADYCSESFIAQHGRLGRSYGCPAVPRAYNTAIINTIKHQSVLYIHADNDQYLATSKWLTAQPNEQLALNFKNKLKAKQYLAEQQPSTTDSKQTL